MVQIVQLDKIRVGDNPRTYFDDDQQKELVASIKAVGLIVPITVTARDDDEYDLVAGERRLRALKTLGVTDGPVYVSSTPQAAGARVIENVVRSDLHPIEEGRAYLALQTAGVKPLSVTALAKQLGISKSRIAARVRLAVLPVDVADILISGSDLNSLTDQLVDFTEAFGGEVVGRFVESMLEALNVLAQPIQPGEYDDRKDVHDLFADFLDHAPDIDIVHLTGSTPVDHAAPDQEALDAHNELVKLKLGKYGRVQLLEEDFDAARAFGVLREFKVSEWQEEVYVTSREWLWDRIKLALERQVKERGDAPVTEGTNGRGEPIIKKPVDPVKLAKAEDREPTQEEKDASAALKAEAKEARDKVKADREAVERTNRALGLSAAKALPKHKLRLTDARLLAKAITSHVGGLVHGWELCTEGQLDGKDEGLKTRSLTDWICRAKSTDEVVGRLLQVIVCGTFADNHALPESKWKGLAFSLLSTSPEMLALAKLAMPEPEYLALAERVEKQAADQRRSMRSIDWRNAKAEQGIFYNDAQGLKPSHQHPFDPASEAPVFIDDLHWSTQPADVYEMAALVTAPTGQLLDFPAGYTYDGGGSVRQLGPDHDTPFRPWVGEPFTKRIQHDEIADVTEAGEVVVAPETAVADSNGDAPERELDNEDAMNDFAAALDNDDDGEA